jgi:hypothetical protein
MAESTAEAPYEGRARETVTDSECEPEVDWNCYCGLPFDHLAECLDR